VGECSFWYQPTRVVPDQRPLNSRRYHKYLIIITRTIFTFLSFVKVWMCIIHAK